MLKLEDVFNKPLHNPTEIRERVEVFQHIEKFNIEIELDRNTYDFVEFYLKKPYYRKPFSLLTGFFEKINYTFNKTTVITMCFSAVFPAHCRYSMI